MTRPVTHTLFWPGTPQQFVHAQVNVFLKHDIPLYQYREETPHGVWMDRVIAKAEEDAIIVFADVDAFPVTREAYDVLTDQARNGAVAGVAQANVHYPAGDQTPYAAPAFMAFSKKTWRAAGSPSMQRTDEYDVGQLLSVQATAKLIPVVLSMPSRCHTPRWDLNKSRCYGTGTVYGDDEFFHLFESRLHKNLDIYCQASREVCQNMSITVSLASCYK